MRDNPLYSYTFSRRSCSVLRREYFAFEKVKGFQRVAGKQAEDGYLGMLLSGVRRDIRLSITPIFFAFFSVGLYGQIRSNLSAAS